MAPTKNSDSELSELKKRVAFLEKKMSSVQGSILDLSRMHSKRMLLAIGPDVPAKVNGEDVVKVSFVLILFVAK
jgi:prefoldin subunit 5